MIINPYVFAAAGGPTDPDFANVVLLMHMDGANGSTTYTDNSGSAHTFAATLIQQTTGTVKFGTASADYGSAGSTQSIASSDSADWDFGSGQFTVECWVKYTTAPTGGDYSAFASQFNFFASGQRSWLFGPVYGQLSLYYSSDGSSYFNMGGAWSPSTGVWYHVAIDRDASNVVRLYVDGVVKASSTVSATFFNSTADLVVGNSGDATAKTRGFIDEVRITKGVARYAGAFTPPTAAFPDS